MPNPNIIHKQSPKIIHFLGLVDIYLALGKPKIYTVEPEITDEYRPDAYTRIADHTPVVIELQRSTISRKKMQHKIDLWVESYKRGRHDASTLFIYTDHPYNLTTPNGFRIEQRKLEVI